MKRKTMALWMAIIMTAALMTGCGASASATTAASESTTTAAPAAEAETTAAEASTEAETTAAASGKKTEIYAFIAASLKNTMEKIKEDYEADHPEVTIIYNADSSGTLQKQIEEGAECDIFFSAATKQMKAFGEFFNNQIEYATVVVLSRTQNVKPEQTEVVAAAIREKNPRAAIITTPWDDIDGKQIYKVIEQQKTMEEELLEEHKRHHEHEHCEHEHHEHEHHEHERHHEHEHHHDHGEDCTCGCHGHGHHHEHGHHHHADEIFTSWGKETPHVFARETIEHALKAFCETEDYGTILRAKGIVPCKDGTWIYFDMVDGEYELRTGEADYTGRLCVIGTDVEEEKLLELFGI